MEKELMSEGKCMYCNATIVQKEMPKHLAAHLAAEEKADSGKSVKTFCHIEVEAGGMFLHLLVKGTGKMEVIDDFLREIWLECCGHMSAFRHKRNEISMDSLVQDVFLPKIKLEHDYDYGTTTTVTLIARKQYQLAVKENITLLSRNEPLKLLCAICNKKAATTLCSVCRWNSYAFFCDGCGKKHAATCPDYDDYARMAVVNSPRMGECGYAGGIIDKERDGHYKM